MLERIRDLHSTFSIGIEIPLDFRDRSTAEKKKLRGFINQKKYEGLRDSEVTRLASRARIANRVQLLTLPALILLAYLSMRAS